MKIRRYFWGFPLLLVLWFLLHTAYVITDGLTDEIAPVDVAVVLGNTVEKNGQPSSRLKARLDKAVALYGQQTFPKIIVSGGLGSEGHDEAGVMRAYLISQGIPAKDIIPDSAGYNTQKTAANTKRIMQAQHMQSVLIITQYYHITRTKLAFQKAGLSPVYAAHANHFEWRDLYSLAREFIGFYAYALAWGS